MKTSGKLLIAGSFLLLVILAIGCDGNTSVVANATPTIHNEAALIVQEDALGTITANSIVVPAGRVSLSFQVSGQVEELAVEVGQKALVTINAFLGKDLTGTVVAISPTAIVQHGDTTYTVTIELEETGIGLRWGMTAQVKVLVED